MKPLRHALLLSIQLLLTAAPAQAAIERVWLSHQTNDPSKTTINWETSTPTTSRLYFGPTAEPTELIDTPVNQLRHHVEVPTPDTDQVWHYRIESATDAEQSISGCFKGTPSQTLRIAIIGDWGFASDRAIDAIVKDDVHLLMTAGDNVANLYQKGAEGTKAFSRLIDAHPALFQSIPFMPILGNHDREITPRGPKPPAHAVYDISATAFCTFFTLPGQEWHWHLDYPGFDLRIATLDLNHITDFGTTWQTCHAFDADSEQFLWYRDLIQQNSQRFFLTVMNERHTTLDSKTDGIWKSLFRQGSALITGFGYFAERAELDGLPYFNTCLKGDGSPYRDPKSAFFASQDNYLLITLEKDADTMTVQFKDPAHGDILDTRVIQARSKK